MTFLAVQTYDSGEVVRWIEPTPEGGEEPESPAPVLSMTGAAPGAVALSGRRHRA